MAGDLHGLGNLWIRGGLMAEKLEDILDPKFLASDLRLLNEMWWYWYGGGYESNDLG